MRTRRDTCALSVTSAVLMALNISCTSVSEPVGSGTISVSVKTSGGDLDNGYEVIVGAQRMLVTINGSLTVTVSAGSQTVLLADIADNCQVDGPASVTVNVERNKSTPVSFSVTCFRTGIEIRTRTTGPDAPGSYDINMTTRGHFPIPANGSIVVSELIPGTYTIELTSPISTCTVNGQSSVTLQVSAGNVIPVTFDVDCVPPVRLEKIAFVIDSQTGDPVSSYLALAMPDGSGVTRIASGESPSWSPDGKKIVYAGHDCYSYYYYYSYCYDELRVIDPETGNDARLTGVPAAGASWAPDGSAIAYATTSPGFLYLIPSAGGSVTRLTLPANVMASDPAWSPDGRRIAFTCSIDRGLPKLCLVSRNGGDFAILSTDSASSSHPAWSPDGQRIAFTALRGQQVEIDVMPAAGGGSTTITDGFDPAWSRDGTKLVFAGADGLFSINPDGTNLQRLTNGRHRAPAWRP